MTSLDALADEWAAAADEEAGATVALRHAIHREPELGLDCPRTRDKLKAALANLPLTIRDSVRTSGFVALLEGTGAGDPSRTVLLRGDMDALPIREATGLDFASEIEGAMHACGHDSHSAMLAGAARVLCRQRDRFAGRILFMFQPGEEGHHGAREMIAEGLIDDPLPGAAFAIHIWPNLPGGVLACRAGAMLASTDQVHIRVDGKGGHAAMPHDAIDPVPVAAEIVLALQSEASRKAPVTTDPIVISISSIHAGETHNVLPDSVKLHGTFRALSPEGRARGRAGIERVATHVALAHGAEAEVWFEDGYPPTMNDPRAVALVRQIAGASYVEAPAPSMGGEDFAYVLQKVPGAMGFLGVAPPDGDPLKRAPLHNPAMLVDDAVLPRGVALHCAFAMAFLQRGFD
ncbi:M20 family metallopeptidase [Sphingomonas sp. ASV193]|uniref:M20 metallopeptidase family protein n=1 Tax=Sphingomonas sp. ASV193 TaxID=3144405 RepID=UPI0032E8A39E